MGRNWRAFDSKGECKNSDNKNGTYTTREKKDLEENVEPNGGKWIWVLAGIIIAILFAFL